jgi:hypothetical protein
MLATQFLFLLFSTTSAVALPLNWATAPLSGNSVATPAACGQGSGYSYFGAIGSSGQGGSREAFCCPANTTTYGCGGYCYSGDQWGKTGTKLVIIAEPFRCGVAFFDLAGEKSYQCSELGTGFTVSNGPNVELCSGNKPLTCFYTYCGDDSMRCVGSDEECFDLCPGDKTTCGENGLYQECTVVDENGVRISAAARLAKLDFFGVAAAVVAVLAMP